MQTVSSKEYRTGFAIDQWDVERLVHVLGGDAAITRLGVDFEDGSSATLEHSGELAALPNDGSRRIRKLLFESAPPAFLSGGDAGARLAIVELRDRGAHAVSCYVSGEDRTVRDLRAELDDWTDSITPWYGRLAFMHRPGLFLASLVLVGSLGILTLAVEALVGGLVQQTSGGSPAGFEVALRLAALASLVLLSVGACWVCAFPRALFPRAQFRFGAGEERSVLADRRRALALRLGGAAAVASILGGSLGHLML